MSPSLIGANAIAFGRNVTCRGAQITTRPGWKKCVLSFDSATTQTRFEDGLWQGAGPFEPFQGGEKLVTSIGGRLFRIDVDNRFAVLEMTGSSLNSPILDKAWFEQAEDFLIVQDGQSAPFIYDGTNLRRTDPTSVPREVPVGKQSLYANGRLWVTLPDGKSFVAGNIVYGEDGTSAYNGRDSVLKFSENAFLNGGGAFGVPFTAGRITAMKAIANLDSSLGQGPIQVFCERGVFSVNAPFDRTTWQNLQYPIQTVSLLGSGGRSHEATILVNGDIFFRSDEGIRSFQVARRNFGAWVNTPMSTEMRQVIDFDDRNLLDHASAVLFDNRYLVTASPYRVKDHGVCWRGVIALDFHNVSGITVRSTPIYDGIWTGLNILQLVPLRDRCFMFVLNPQNKIELWEASLSDPFDNGSTRISAFIDTPRFSCGDSGWNRKQLSAGDCWISDAIGQVDFDVQFRPDNYPCYLPWHAWGIDSKDKTCLTTACTAPDSLNPQYRTRMRLPVPGESCNNRVNMSFREGFEFQCRVAWTGHVRIDRFRVICHEVQEDSGGFCEPSETSDTSGIACCTDSLFGYRSDA